MLTQATFGVKQSDLDTLTGTSASAWFLNEMTKPASLNLPYVLQELQKPYATQDDGYISVEGRSTENASFWINAITADDQLRQRMAYALSQILVVSDDLEVLAYHPETVATFQDILVSNAFGNYRDILEEVTYSLAMGHYLTYFQNEKQDPDTGQMPDENYAREVMQLFSIGLVELNMDGSARIDALGAPRETYDNDDVTGLAKVFTGLSLDADRFNLDRANYDDTAFYSPMIVFPDRHSELEKSFLGTTIPAGTSAEESIDIALDTLIDHPNTPPFISRQLIQRFVTSHPSPAYIERVATAFADGSYTLPSGDLVGDGRRGDLAATLAAILFDEEARSDAAREQESFGKLREPVIRFINWTRTFDASTIIPRLSYITWDTTASDSLSQQPFRSPSVFNFYRPGYVAPGTETGAANLTMPEMQLMNANTIAGYTNFMSFFVFAIAARNPEGVDHTNFIPDYTDEKALSDDPAALVDHLDLLLTYGSASDETKQNIVDFISQIPPEWGENLRVHMAVLMMMTAPDYLVQR